MAQPTLRDVIGVIDGSNTVFSTPTGYAPGTLRVWHNGRLLQAELDNGFTEGTPPNFTMKVPPRVEDQLNTLYKEC